MEAAQAQDAARARYIQSQSARHRARPTSSPGSPTSRPGRHHRRRVRAGKAKAIA